MNTQESSCHSLHTISQQITPVSPLWCLLFWSNSRPIQVKRIYNKLKNHEFEVFSEASPKTQAKLAELATTFRRH